MCFLKGSNFYSKIPYPPPLQREKKKKVFPSKNRSLKNGKEVFLKLLRRGGLPIFFKTTFFFSSLLFLKEKGRKKRKKFRKKRGPFSSREKILIVFFLHVLDIQLTGLSN
jgi:hypothetical protein